MEVQVDNRTPEHILQQIDGIIQELQSLRMTVAQMQNKPLVGNLAEELFGSLGKGTWEEYDFDLDWQRFDQ
jgi:hypothetical protein